MRSRKMRLSGSPVLDRDRNTSSHPSGCVAGLEGPRPSLRLGPGGGDPARLTLMSHRRSRSGQHDRGDTDCGRRHRPRSGGRGGERAGRARQPVRVGPPVGRHGGRGRSRRPAARGHAGQHPPHPAGAERPADHPRRRRVPLGQRAAAGGIPPLRQRAPGPHPDPGGALRRHRPGDRAREPGGVLRRLRALHPGRGGPARGGDLVGHQHAGGGAADPALRVRLRRAQRPQEGHRRAQGQRAEGADRAVPGRGAQPSPPSMPGGSRWTTASWTPAPCSSC